MQTFPFHYSRRYIFASSARTGRRQRRTDSRQVSTENHYSISVSEVARKLVEQFERAFVLVNARVDHLVRRCCTAENDVIRTSGDVGAPFPAFACIASVRPCNEEETRFARYHNEFRVSARRQLPGNRSE